MAQPPEGLQRLARLARDVSGYTGSQGSSTGKPTGAGQKGTHIPVNDPFPRDPRQDENLMSGLEQRLHLRYDKGLAAAEQKRAG